MTKFIVTFEPRGDHARCRVCDKDTTNSLYLYNMRCEHCRINHHALMVGLNMARYDRGSAIAFVVAGLIAVSMAAWCFSDAWNGVNVTFNLIVGAVNFVIATYDGEGARKNWARWTHYAPLWKRLAT